MTRKWNTLLHVIALLIQCSSGSSVRAQHRQHAVEISNDSEQKVAVDWFNPMSREAVPFASMRSGETLQLKSFTNHTFVIHYDNETCADQYCRSSVITISDDDHQGKKGRNLGVGPALMFLTPVFGHQSSR